MRKFHYVLIGIAFAAIQPFSAHAQTANGRATTTAPTYTNGQAAPLSLDTSGNMRVNCVTGCSTSGGTSDVNIKSVGGNTVTTSVPVSGTVGISGTVPISGSVGVSSLPALPAGSNNIGSVGIVGTPSVNAAVSGNVGITGALPTGANTIGAVNVNGTISASLSGSSIATSNFSLLAAASTNATAVKASAGVLYELSVYNNSANIAYLKFYNATSATCGSGTPVARYLIPGAAAGGAGSNVVIPLGKTFSTGISFCLTGGIADADTTAVAASTYLVNITYK